MVQNDAIEGGDGGEDSSNVCINWNQLKVIQDTVNIILYRVGRVYLELCSVSIYLTTLGITRSNITFVGKGKDTTTISINERCSRQQPTNFFAATGIRQRETSRTLFSTYDQ